jgi:hypothetical protein
MTVVEGLMVKGSAVGGLSAAPMTMSSAREREGRRSRRRAAAGSRGMGDSGQGFAFTMPRGGKMLRGSFPLRRDMARSFERASGGGGFATRQAFSGAS